jgi:hypothetical protein
MRHRVRAEPWLGTAGLAGKPALRSCEAAQGAPPPPHPPRDPGCLGGCDFAAGRGRQNGRQHLPEIFDCAHCGEVEPETLRRVASGERRRQQLHRERAQQMGLAVEEVRQGLRAERPGDEIGDPPPGVADAARPTSRVAGAALQKAPARIAHARQQGIRTNPLRFLDPTSGKQQRTTRRTQIGFGLRHRQRVSLAIGCSKPHMDS